MAEKSSPSKKPLETSVEAPSLTIELGALGIFPVSITIPLPSFKFGDKNRDALEIHHPGLLTRIHGWIDGGNGLPNSQDIEATYFESKILNKHEKKMLEIDLEMRQHRLAIGNAMNEATKHQFDTDAAVGSVKNQVSNWVANCKRQLQECCTRESEKANEFRAAEEELNQFVRNHNISEIKPTSAKGWQEKFIVLVFFAVIDIAFSTGMFLNNERTSLPIALLTAILITAVNISTGILCGRSLLEAKRSNANAATKHYLIAMLFAICSIAITIAAAIKRDQGLQIDEIIFVFSLNSLLLFILSLIIFYFSATKGFYVFGTVYPGHESRWENYEVAKSSFQEWKDVHSVLIAKSQREGARAMEIIPHQVDSYLASISTSINDVKSYVANIETNIGRITNITKRINDSADSILKLYTEWSFKRQSGKSINYRRLAKMELDISISDERRKAQDILSQLNSIQNSIKTFRIRFQSDIVPSINRGIEEISSFKYK